MAQMTWRSDDELLGRVKRAAQRHGRSMNDYVTAVLDAATDPDLAGDEVERLRERIEQAGLSVSGDRRRRPEPSEVSRARASAGRGRPLSDLVDEGR